MSSRMKQLVVAMVLLSALCAWAPAALAYRAPYADSDVTLNTEEINNPDDMLRRRLSHSIYDPVRNQVITAVSPAYHGIDNISVTGGIVSFEGTNFKGITPYEDFVYTSVYDPALGAWVTDISGPDWGYYFRPTCVKDGIVAFQSPELFPNKAHLYLKTYDPGAQAWKVFIKESINDFKIILIQDGIVGYKQNKDILFHTFTDIGMAVYDPRDGAWHVQEDSNNDGDLNVRIENLMVKYTDNSNQEQKWVYDSIAYAWVKNPPTDVVFPVPYFVAQPNTGPPPLNVWFTDMSILSSAVTWDFGDGGFADQRSLRHTYTYGGSFTVYQKASSPYLLHQTSQTITVQDVTPPEGRMFINGGATYTNSRAVTLQVNLTDADPGTQIRYCNSGDDWTAWENPTPTKSWSLPIYDGRKAVYAQIRDHAGNITEIYDTIVVDTTPPTGAIVINSGAQYTNTPAVTLNLSADDSGRVLPSGVTSMEMCNMVKDGNGAWVIPSGFAFTPVPFASSQAWNLSAGDGAKRVAVFFRDAAGNFSPMYAAVITLDSTKPSGFSISFGARYTKNPDVTLFVSAGGQDTSVLQMSIGTWAPFPLPGRTVWGDWQPFAATVPIHLTEQYTKKYAKFKDAAGNISSSVDTYIILDTTAPTDGTVTATPGNKQITLNWSGFSDNTGGSGLNSYNVYFLDPKWFLQSYRLLSHTGNTSVTHQNLREGARYRYKVTAFDNVGNESAGVEVQARTRCRKPQGLPLLLGD